MITDSSVTEYREYCQETANYFAWMLDRVGLQQSHYDELEQRVSKLKSLSRPLSEVEHPAYGRSLELIYQIENYLTIVNGVS